MRSILLPAAFALLALAPAWAADDIASKRVNDPSRGWVASGAGASAVLYDDPSVQGGKAERFTISAKSANPWDYTAHVSITKPLAKGDVLLLAFWAKAEQPPGGATAIVFNANIQKDSAPYTSLGNGMLSVGPEWKMYFVQAVADQDYNADAVGAQLQLAIDHLVIDLGPLFILNYGKDYDRTKLPKS